MRLLELFQILDEGRLDYLQQQWAEKVNTKARSNPADRLAAQSRGGDAFRVLVNADPTNNKQFLQWLIKLYMNDQMPLEDAYKAVEYLDLFVKHKRLLPATHRDINRHKTLQDLYATVRPHEEVKTQGEVDRETYEEMHNKPHAQVLHNDKVLKIVQPLTKKANCFHGVNTKWCTAAKESNNMFDYYNKKGPMYIVLHKPSNRRWQFHFDAKEYKDETDTQIQVIDLVKEIPQLREIFGDPIDEAVIMQDPRNIKELENPSQEIENFAVELMPMLAADGSIEEPTDAQRMAAIGRHPELYERLASIDEEHRYEEMRDTVESAESSDEIEHGVGSIEYLYDKRGMTPDLLRRITDAFDEMGSSIAGYSMKNKSFIGHRWKDREEFVEHQMPEGSVAMWAKRIFDGSGRNDFTIHEYGPDAEENAWKSLDHSDREAIGYAIRNKIADDGDITIDSDGDVWIEGYADPIEYDPTDYQDIELLLDKTGDKNDFKTGFIHAAYTGEERGQETELYNTYIEWLENIEPSTRGYNVPDEWNDLGIYLQGSRDWDSPVNMLLPEKTLIPFVSAWELNHADGAQEYYDDWVDAFDYPDMSEPDYGYADFDGYAAQESLRDHFWHELKAAGK